ncbi:MAG TPA: hypothetical protein VG870_10175 [Chitinophagaceae bacterium]|nr:hypothetical protein [Chitinophagaceae bacterium]
MRKITILAIIFITSLTAGACEICGCGMGNYYIGLLPQFRRSFFGLRYQYNHFQTVMKNDPTQFSRDYYQTLELWSGVSLSRRWQLLAFVPVNFNRQVSDEGTSQRNGLGDITLLADYKLLDLTRGGNRAVSQQLWVGGGVKLATGQFTIDPADQDLAAVANGQIGSGSTDFILNAMYTVRVNQLGITTNAGYKINTDNRDQYRFGNRFTANSLVSYSLPAGTTTITPNAGALYEHSDPSHLQGSKINLTGGNLLLASAGVEFSRGKISTGFNVQLPVAQDFAEGQTKSRVRGMLHVTFAL